MSDPHFINYLKARKTSTLTPKDFSARCEIPEWDYQLQTLKRECVELIEGFLEEAKIAIILDFVIHQSFYIRQRDCIEGIRGTVEDQVLLLNERDALWEPRCSGYTLIAENTGLMLAHLTRLGIERGKPPKFDSARMIANAKRIHESSGKMVATFLDQLEKCRKAGKLEQFKDRLKVLFDSGRYRSDFSDLSGIRCDLDN